MDDSKKTILLKTIVIATLVVSSGLLFIVLVLNVVSMTKLNFAYRVGVRTEEECAEELTEAETRRYAIFRAFATDENNTFSTLKYFHTARLFMTLSNFLLVTGVAAFLFLCALFAYRNLKNANGSDDERTKKMFTYLISAAVVGGVFVLMTGAFVILDGVAISKANTDSKAMTVGFTTAKVVALLAMLAVGLWGTVALDTQLGVGSLKTFLLIFAGLFVVSLVFDPVTAKQMSDISKVVRDKYSDDTVKLLNEISKLKNDERVRRYLVGTIYKVEGEMVSPDLVFEQDGGYVDKLWKYVEHRGGKELESVVGGGKGANVVDDLRKYMFKLRSYTAEMEKVTRKYIRGVFVTSLVSFIVMFAVLFHAAFMHAPTETVVVSAAALLALVVIGTCYGWFAGALLL